MSKGPSKHLSWHELQCKDGTPYPNEWRTNRAIELAEVFELVRFECGSKPIQVISGYRTPKHNRRIGGAPKSQHLQGRALDIKPPRGITNLEFYKRILKLARDTRAIRGLGYYNTFVHIDTRPSTKLIKWNGGSALKDTINRDI
jgi:uncharacterized protein YcbK (DUF882 family)